MADGWYETGELQKQKTTLSAVTVCSDNRQQPFRVTNFSLCTSVPAGTNIKIKKRRVLIISRSRPTLRAPSPHAVVTAIMIIISIIVIIIIIMFLGIN